MGGSVILPPVGSGIVAQQPKHFILMLVTNGYYATVNEGLRKKFELNHHP